MPLAMTVRAQGDGILHRILTVVSQRDNVMNLKIRPPCCLAIERSRLFTTFASPSGAIEDLCDNVWVAFKDSGGNKACNRRRGLFSLAPRRGTRNASWPVSSPSSCYPNEPQRPLSNERTSARRNSGAIPCALILIRMLEHFGVGRWFGLGNASALWGEGFRHLQPMALLPHPTAKRGMPFAGNFSEVLSVPVSWAPAEGIHAGLGVMRRSDPLSLRHLEEMMAERGISVDHSTVHRWALKLLPMLEQAFRRHKRAVGRSWRMDETYIKVKGEWKYLYRAVDKAGDTVDFLFRAKRDTAAARRYFETAIDQNGAPGMVTIDKSSANLAGLHAINAQRERPIRIRQAKYLNNIVEQDHRAIKRRTRPMLGFKVFRCARILLGGIEVMNMIVKGQMKYARGTNPSAADQFYSLAM